MTIKAGTFVKTTSPHVIEVLGVSGLDFAVLDAEHAPNDVLSMIPQLMALKDSASAPVVRPPSNDVVVIKRLLDAGFHNFLVPYVESVEEARRAVEATRHPPQGVRGVSVSQRSNRYGSVPGYFEQINDNIAVALQIESRKGVDAAPDIARIDGVDALFIGPSDLAAAYGHLGQPGHPEVQEAMAKVFDAAKAAGKSVGILSPAEADARRYMSQGATTMATKNENSIAAEALAGIGAM